LNKLRKAHISITYTKIIEEENLNRKQISIVIVVIMYCFAYFLLGTFPMVTLFSPNLNPYFGFSLWIFFIFYFLFLSLIILERSRKFRLEDVDWLKLHRIFSYLEPSLPMLFFVPLVIIVSFVQDLSTKEAVVIWFYLFIVFFQTVFSRIENAVGMDYRKKGIPPLYRASAFATLSRSNLERRNEKGIGYLGYTLTILRENLNQKKRTLNSLGETISAVNTVSSLEQKIPYEQLVCLAERLEKLPVLNGVTEELHSFVNCKEIRWTRNFLETPTKTRQEKISSYFERYLLPMILVAATFLGVLPETIRSWLIEALQRLEWIQIIGFILLIVLSYASLLVLLSSKYRYRLPVENHDIEELSKLRKERLKQ
jgi:hypothetical protein